MTPAEVLNWIAIYTATGMCCAVATILSAATVGYELVQERAWSAVTSWKSALLLAPKIWCRWQKRYLFSTPVTLAIVGAFALALDWSR